MSIVAKYKIGNCTITIDDKYCVKTKEETDRIIRNIEDFYADCIKRGTIDIKGFIKSED